MMTDYPTSYDYSIQSLQFNINKNINDDRYVNYIVAKTYALFSSKNHITTLFGENVRFDPSDFSKSHNYTWAFEDFFDKEIGIYI